MLKFIRKRFARKLVLLIGLAFLIPVVTSVSTILMTSEADLEWFQQQLDAAHADHEQHAELRQALARYEEGRRTALVTTLIVVSFVFAGVIILLSLLMLKRAMATLAELSFAADQVAGRNFDLQIEAHSRDEFRDLVHAFQEMARHLKETTVAKDLAEESSRLRSEFLANMSHEFRTPLNGILGLAQALEHEESDAEKKAHLNTITKCGENLLQLINEILQLSKIEAGRMEMHVDQTSPKTVVLEAVATVKQLCRQRDIGLTIDISPETPGFIHTDRRKLTQVLLNLLGNATKYTQRGNIQIVVTPSAGNRKGSLLFQVSDTGKGIAKERLPYIFESFVQAEDYLERAAEGTGLGLTIAQKLVEMMGGEIWVESELGKGTTFFFTIDGKAA